MSNTEPKPDPRACICGRKRSPFAGMPDVRVPNPNCPFPGHASS